jgi:TRAP-type C4-dicarboxylate transport system permease small subunit
LKTAEDIIKKISSLLNGASCAALAALMLMVTINVIMRKVFNAPILGTYDLSGFLTVIAIGCGLAFCNIENGHIEIEFFVSKAGRRTQKWITAAGRVLSFFVLTVYTYALVNLGSRLMKANEVSVTTKTPLFVFVYLLAVCFFVFALTVLVKIFEKNTEGDQK